MDASSLARCLEQLGCSIERSAFMAEQLTKRAHQLVTERGWTLEQAMKHLLQLLHQAGTLASNRSDPTPSPIPTIDPVVSSTEGSPAPPAIQPWPLLRSEVIGNYRIFRLRRDWRRSPRTGKEHDFFVMQCPDWVNVIALTPEGKAVMVEQFRHGTATVDLEVPGGVMDAIDASPVETAMRELREETGYEGRHARLLGSIAPNPAIQNNWCHTVLIEDCHPTAAMDLDPGEDLATRLVPASDLPRLVREGRLPHALVAVAVLHFELWRQEQAGLVQKDPTP